MAQTPKPKVDQKVKSGPKKRPPDAGWVQFEVSPAIYQHLEWLIPRSGLGEDVNEVAKSLFGFEVQRSMKDPKLHSTDPSTWFTAPVEAEDEQE